MVLGEAQLLDVEKILPRAIQARYEMIQSDLADRHQSGVITVRGEGLVQALKVGLVRRGRVQRVDAQGIAVAPLVGQRADALEMVGADSGQHAVRHARLSGAGPHREAVCRELGRVEVAVGIDPDRHRLMMP
jgi:hypothetical protein